MNHFWFGHIDNKNNLIFNVLIFDNLLGILLLVIILFTSQYFINSSTKMINFNTRPHKIWKSGCFSRLTSPRQCSDVCIMRIRNHNSVEGNIK